MRPPRLLRESLIGLGLFLTSPPTEARAEGPPEPAALDLVPLLIATLFVGALFATGLRLWRRSPWAIGHAVFRRLDEASPQDVAIFITRQITDLSPKEAQVFLIRLADRLARERDESRFYLSRSVRKFAKLLDCLQDAEARLEPTTQSALAQAFEERATTAFAMAENTRETSDLHGIQPIALSVASQDRLFAALLRAEGLVHLAALRTQLTEVEHTGRGQAYFLYFPDFIDTLGQTLDLLEQFPHLPEATDRALLVGQALSSILRIQESLERDLAQRATFGRRVGAVALESLRRLLSTAIQEIHQRVELAIHLRSKLLATQREAVVVLEIKNVGQGHAHNLRAELLPSNIVDTLQRYQEVKSLLRQQSARLEFLVEPKVSDRVRLHFEICYDDLEGQGHRDEFADVVEFRQIAPRQTFRPLRPNPYVVGRPLLDSDVFFGREEIFSRLESSLKGANQDNVVVVMGPRRMGKTSILRRLHRVLGESYAPVLIDLQGMMGTGQEAFFRELAGTVVDELEELGVEIEEPAPEAFDIDPGNTFRRRFLKAVQRTLGSRRLLFMFDEFEVLEGRIRGGDLEPRILHYFRSLMQHEKNISFIFAGTHRLDELTRDYWGVLFNLAVYLDVGHLPREQTQSLFTDPTQDFFEIDSLALDKALHLTGGHPHFSQLLARELVEVRNHRQLAYVTVQDINAVAEMVAEKGQLHINYLWEESNHSQKLLLLAVSDLLERKGLATLSAVDRHLRERHLTAHDLPLALRQLVRKEVLVDNAGLLTFRMELLRLWLERQHSLDAFESDGKSQVP